MRRIYTNESLDTIVPDGAMILYNQYDRSHVTNESAYNEATRVRDWLAHAHSFIRHFQEDLSAAHNGHIVVLAHSDGQLIKCERQNKILYPRWSGDTFYNRMNTRGLFNHAVQTFYLVACNAADGFAEGLWRALDRNHVVADVVAPNGTAQVMGNGSVRVNLNWSMWAWSLVCLGSQWTRFTADAPPVVYQPLATYDATGYMV